MTAPSAPARKVVLSLYMSLDGVIQEPAWTAPFWADDVAAYKHAELFASDLLLLGRVTYQGFAAARPTMEGTADFGERMNSLPKVVATTTLSVPEWNATFIRGDVAAEVERLKGQPGRDILIYGSGTFARELMRHALIDEYHLLVYPLALGSGERLFHDDGPPLRLKLTHSQTFSTGVVALTYRPEHPSSAL